MGARALGPEHEDIEHARVAYQQCVAAQRKPEPTKRVAPQAKTPNKGVQSFVLHGYGASSRSPANSRRSRPQSQQGSGCVSRDGSVRGVPGTEGIRGELPGPASPILGSTRPAASNGAAQLENRFKN